jgi:AsmA protein
VPIGLKRLSLFLAAVFVAAIGLLFAASAFIPAERVRTAVLSEIRNVTGLEPRVRGDVVVSLFPTATVTFTDVVLGDDAKPVLAADRLTATLRLLPLLGGQIETADVALARPRVTITVDADGRSNWSNLIATLARSLKPGAKPSERVMSFSEIRMTGGTIAVSDAAHGIDEMLSGVEVSLAWPSIARSFGATGRFTWRGEPFDVVATAGDLFSVLSGDRSGLKARLTGTPFKLAFDGQVANKPALRVEGTLSADGASLRSALRWAGRSPPPAGGLGPFALKAQIVLARGSVTLNQVNIELDGNAADGVLAFSNEPRMTMKGTLAADTLDLTPYLSAVEWTRTNERDWSRVPIAVDGLNDFDLDLRLSAGRITLATAKLGRTGVAANLRDGRLTVAVGEAQAFGGVLRGSLLLAKSSTGADIKSLLQFSDVDLDQCLGELFGIRKLEGKGDIAMALEANGDSMLALTRTLGGNATLAGRQGALSGFNVEQLLRRLEQRPLSIGGDFRRGRTPFDKLNVAIKFVQGTANVEAVSLEGGPVRLALAGSASIPSRELDLKGTAALLTSANAAPSFELPFVVQGLWDDPIMLPDARSLIRRSGAGAPLLDALRDRRTRDQVRDAIDHLTRDRATPPAAAAPPPAAVTQAAPSAVDSAPSAVDSAPSAAQKAPSAAQKAPAATQKAPSAAESAPSPAQSTPSATQTAPSAADQTPAATQTAPSATQSAPSAVQSAPSAVEKPPATR